MGSPHRPVTGLDHYAKESLVHAGLVFSGHLDVPRLRQSASEVLNVFPELNVVAKRRLLSPGRWHTPPASKPAWDFKDRDLPGKSLVDVFAPAARALDIDLGTSAKVIPLGATTISDMQALFSFDAPSISSLGWFAMPSLSFRVTKLGGKDNGHTLLSMIFPHVITDSVGAAAIIETWGRIYRGESIPTRTDNSHPDLMGLLDSVYGNTSEKIKEDERPGQGVRIGLGAVLSFIRDLRSFSDNFGFEEHYIHFPRALLEKYRDEAREQLTEENKGMLISRLDIFCAMMMKLYAHSSLGSDKALPLDFYHVYNVAPGFPKDSLPSPYLHNLNASGWFPFPSALAVSSASLPELAIAVRRRLNALRTPSNIREQILHNERHAGTFLLSPRVDARHSWGMVVSWKEVDEMARRGFAGENLVFVRPFTQNSADLPVPNIAFPWGDGKGGLFTRVAILKGDWDNMWEKSGLGKLG